MNTRIHSSIRLVRCQLRMLRGPCNCALSNRWLEAALTKELSRRSVLPRTRYSRGSMMSILSQISSGRCFKMLSDRTQMWPQLITRERISFYWCCIIRSIIRSAPQRTRKSLMALRNGVLSTEWCLISRVGSNSLVNKRWFRSQIMRQRMQVSHQLNTYWIQSLFQRNYWTWMTIVCRQWTKC